MKGIRGAKPNIKAKHIYKKEWGNAMWYFMHTFAYKLNEEFSHKAKEIMVLYYNICIDVISHTALSHYIRIVRKVRTA